MGPAPNLTRNSGQWVQAVGQWAEPVGSAGQPNPKKTKATQTAMPNCQYNTNFEIFQKPAKISPTIFHLVRLQKMGELLKNSIFFSDQHLCHADILPPSDVRARIEVAVLNFLKNLNSAASSVSALPVINRKTSNSRVSRGLLIEHSKIFLSHSFCTQSLMNENTANSFMRVWKVMEMCYQILGQGKKVTQRELFYKLLCDSPQLFTSQLQVNRTVQDLVALLKCSRYSLGIMASSRGAVAGRLLLQAWAKSGSRGLLCLWIFWLCHLWRPNVLENLVMKSDARYIIVVEKHAIFQRLAEDRIFNQIPCILITAKGYPDIGTRLFLHRMSREFPELPIIGLVDWNPAGLAILCTFKYGSVTMGLEAYRYACNVKWLGLRKDDIEQFVPEESLVPLKQRDHQIAKNLSSSEILQDNYKEELAVMIESGHRAEIEALYFHGYDFLAKYIGKKIVQADYI
ncbi:type 2 DNA topoisomerase 6 subunit A [Striga asiatica]|uniref:DNA topoisomerase (ATP-hydrolyzing) n=1 Tax=Striga asiatica TaxID=4170 RepID=A0A5A7QB91_STRAF|nr:type 2 DNA topoisomerase 6 subunit A [Striga asiatica]